MFSTPYLWPLILASVMVIGVCIYLPHFKAAAGSRLRSKAPTAARSRAMENIHDLVIILDARMRIVDANQPAIRVLGLPSRRPAGRTVDGLLPAWAELFQHCLLQPAGSEEVIVGCGDGCRTYILSIAPLQDAMKGPGRYLFLLHDITSRKCIELAVQESEAKFLCLAKKMAATCSIATRERLTSYESTYQSSTGYSADEMLNLDEADLFIPMTD
jgi:hypothetical protein